MARRTTSIDPVVGGGPRGRQRSRATVIADTARAPAASSAVAHAESVAPVVMTSSMSRIHRPRTSAGRPGPARAGRHPRRWRPGRAGRGRTGRSCSARGRAARRGADRARRGHEGDVLRLVVAAPLRPLRVHRDVRHERGPDADPRPAPSHGSTERPGESALAGVLDRVEGIAGEAVEAACTSRSGRAARARRRGGPSACRPARRVGCRVATSHRRQIGGPSAWHPGSARGKAASSGRHRRRGRLPEHVAQDAAGHVRCQLAGAARRVSRGSARPGPGPCAAAPAPRAPGGCRRRRAPGRAWRRSC